MLMSTRWAVGACRAWSVDREKRPQREQFLPDLQPHSTAMGQKDGKKWTAAAALQPTNSKSDRLLWSFARVAATVVVVLGAAALAGCGKPEADSAPTSAANASFDALVAACTKTIDARTFTVLVNGQGEWVKTGYSPASVQGEVTPTESAITPYLGKLVIKDNTARVSADSEAQATAATLTPTHVLSNHTYTFIFRFDGKQWVWSNGSLVTKTKTTADVTQAITQADVAAAGAGFAGCLPQ